MGSDSPLVGRWKVEFANGVKEACRIGTNRTAVVSEALRTATGLMESRDNSVVISYQDDRIERWTPVGDRCVVEHWFPVAAFSNTLPVLGIADRASETESFGWHDPTRDDTDVWMQIYFRCNGILTNSVLQVGMTLNEFIKVLGEPTQRYYTKDGRVVGPEYEDRSDKWVEWCHNPRGMHVAPFIRVRVEDGAVKEVRAGRG